MSAYALTGGSAVSIMGKMANPFEGVRAVLFDMDGTLAETDIDFPLMKREMLALCEKYGVAAPEAQELDILAITALLATRLKEQGCAEEAGCAKREAFEKLEQIELKHCDRAQPVPGALELLEELRAAGLKVGIVTRNSRNGARLSIERTGISSDVILTRDDVSNAKPHPEHLLSALESLGVRPHEAVIVGDHWMDVIAGKAVGTRTVGFLRAGRREDFFDRTAPDFVIRDLTELLVYLKRMKS